MRSATGFCVCFTSSASLSSSLLGCCGSAACVDSATSRKRRPNNKKISRTFIMPMIHPAKIQPGGAALSIPMSLESWKPGLFLEKPVVLYFNGHRYKLSIGNEFGPIYVAAVDHGESGLN